MRIPFTIALPVEVAEQFDKERKKSDLIAQLLNKYYSTKEDDERGGRRRRRRRRRR